MIIAGLQKMTLLDFPGKVACTVFLPGCNLRCPFCHNSELFEGPVPDPITVEDFLVFLDKRKGLLDAVCVSGGEPTGHKDLPQLLRGIREKGFAIKLDTNGSRPEVLKTLVEEGLLDYVAMDIKNSPDRYAETCGLRSMDLTPYEQSIRFLLEGHVDYEFRTTVVAELHDEASISDMGAWLTRLGLGKKPKKMFLQPFVDRDTVAYAGLNRPEDAKMCRYLGLLQPVAEQIAIRG